MGGLGLVGCGGLAVTAAYHQGIVESMIGRTGDRCSLGLTIECLPGLDAAALVDEGNLGELTERLSAVVERLAAAGCAVAAVDCLAAHAVFDAVRQRSPIPLVSLVETVRAKVVARQYRRVILLGAPSDMRGAYLKAPLAKAGCAVLVPGAADRAWLGEAMAGELARGVVQQKTAAHLAALLADGAEHGAEALVVTAPELVPLVAQACVKLPVVDAVQVHVRALVDAALEP